MNNNWGTTPTQIQPAIVKLKLNIQADSIKIYPLSNIGKEGVGKKIVPTTANNFDVTLDQNQDKTLWYGVETFGIGSTTGIVPTNPNMPILNRSYPNPVYDNAVTLDYAVRENGTIHIGIYDLTGKLVKNVLSAWQPVGQYSLKVDIGNLPTGQYNIILNEENLGFGYFSYNMAYLPLVVVH